MGLDTVELVMAFEETFGIDIPDDAAEGIVTVRQAIDFIYGQVEHRSGSTTCLTQRAFHRLRRSARDVLGVERSLFRPKTEWTALIPERGRREAWSRLGAAVGVSEWPSLTRSSKTLQIVAAAVATTTAIAFLIAPTDKIAVAAITGVVSTWAALRASAHWQIHFAKNDATVGQIAELIAAKHPEAWGPTKTGWTHAEVRQVVRRIVVEHLNVDPNFSDDASFIDDLGAD